MINKSIQEKLDQEKKKALEELDIAKKKAEIREIKSRYGIPLLFRRIRDSRTFTIASFIFLNIVVVEIYCMWAMIYLKDISAINGLISSVIGQGIVFAVYCYKSYRSKKEEVASKLLRDKFEFEKKLEDITDDPEMYISESDNITSSDDNNVG